MESLEMFVETLILMSLEDDSGMLSNVLGPAQTFVGSPPPHPTQTPFVNLPRIICFYSPLWLRSTSFDDCGPRLSLG